MKAIIYIISLFFFTSFTNLVFAQEYEGVEETDQFHITQNSNEVTLTMSYASPVVKNPESWTSIKGKKRITEVVLVFTKYPFRSKDWITHYDSLLYKRKNALAELIPELTISSGIRWRYVLQNSCKTEAEAKQLFHGAIVKYTPVLPPPLHLSKKDTVAGKPKPILIELPLDFSMKDMVNGNFKFADSIVFKVFNRHPEWEDMLVVNDWTGSMYEFGAQTVLWNKINLEKQAVKQFVFFNDGDNKKDFKKEIGRTGGIYFCQPESLEKIIETMDKVMQKGYGGDMPENNLEALITAIRKTKDFKEVVMIADNRSPVRDMILLNQIKIPIRIILCGSYPGGPIIPDYIEIARRTGGSIHTIEEDILHLADLQEGDKVGMLNIPYIFLNGRFERISRKAPENSLFE